MHPDIGKLILRLSLGGMMLLHGIAKLQHGMGWIGNSLASHGLPSWFAYGVFIGELLAPVMVIIGLYTRVGAGLMVINMLFAIFLAHSGEILALGKYGGWAIELQAFYLFTALALCFLGSGRFALKN
ncbi:MAG: DoxX family protein [Gammaproteobacteria bacterium]|nr:MAG: DoxX family protein [Gammaproteobacteria bacterium]